MSNPFFAVQKMKIILGSTPGIKLIVPNNNQSRVYVKGHTPFLTTEETEQYKGTLIIVTSKMTKANHRKAAHDFINSGYGYPVYGLSISQRIESLNVLPHIRIVEDIDHMICGHPANERALICKHYVHEVSTNELITEVNTLLDSEYVHMVYVIAPRPVNVE